MNTEPSASSLGNLSVVLTFEPNRGLSKSVTFPIVDDTEGGEDDEQYKSVNFLSFCVSLALVLYFYSLFLPLSLSPSLSPIFSVRPDLTPFHSASPL